MCLFKDLIRKYLVARVAIKPQVNPLFKSMNDFDFADVHLTGSSSIFPAGVIPNHDLASVANLVPGAELLGYGFNIFGSYDFASATRPLLTLGSFEDWNAPNGQVYKLPSQVAIGGGVSSAASYAFDTAQQFAGHFQSSAGVSGSYGAFSTSFSTSYQSDQRSEQSYCWAMVESKVISWVLNLAYSSYTIRADVLSDPDFTSLPSSYDATNAHLFFAFFNKFGTHFISSIDVGGTLYYYFAISRSASYSSNDIRVSASAEYNALIAKVKVEADAQWRRTSSNWTQNRQSHAVTVPAVSNLVGWVDPAVGTYDQNNDFANWQTQVTNYPVRSAFRLTPITLLFSGSQATAVQQAYLAYACTRVLVQTAPYKTPTIIVGGLTVVPPGGYPANDLGGIEGWQLVVLDRKTLTIRLNEYYLIGDYFYLARTWPDAMYNKMVSDIQPFMEAGRYVLLAATAGIDTGASPTNEFYGVLKSFGAGSQLDFWMGGVEHGCSGAYAAYAMVGVSGMPNGREGFTWTEGSGLSNAPTPPANPVISLDAFMQPQGDGSFLPMFPYG